MEEQRKVKVMIYHHADDDGKAAAAIFADHLGLHSSRARIRFFDFEFRSKFSAWWPEITATNIPIKTYNEIFELPAMDKPDKDVLLVFLDYSFSNKTNLENLKKFIETNSADQVFWIDHHATSVELLKDPENEWLRQIPNKLVDSVCSGTMLTYMYFNTNYRLRGTLDELTESDHTLKEHGAIASKYCDDPILRYIDDYDTTGPGSYKYPETLSFHVGFSMEKRKDDVFELANIIRCADTNYIEQMCSIGESILEYQKIEDAKFRSYAAFYFTIDGYRCIALNRKGNAIMFGDLYDSYDIVCPFYFDGKKWTYSLYSNKQYVSCQKIAKLFGGGGHPGAAGFSTDDLIISAGCHIDTVQVRATLAVEKIKEIEE